MLQQIYRNSSHGRLHAQQAPREVQAWLGALQRVPGRLLMRPRCGGVPRRFHEPESLSDVRQRRNNARIRVRDALGALDRQPSAHRQYRHNDPETSQDSLQLPELGLPRRTLLLVSVLRHDKRLQDVARLGKVSNIERDLEEPTLAIGPQRRCLSAANIL